MFNLIVVEDEDMIRHKVLNNVDWLSNGFQHVFEAENGSEALDIMAVHKIDILITDIKMPKMDGIELTKHVKSLHPKTKVIIISGHADFDYARKSITLNVSHYVLKPFQSKKLLKLVNEVKEELVRELGEQEHLENMKNQLKHNKQSLREKLIENLLNNTYVGNLLNDLNNLQMHHLEGIPFFVAVMNIQQMDEVGRKKNSRRFIYEWINTSLQAEWGQQDKTGKFEKGYVLNYKIDQVVIISFQEQITVKHLLKQLIDKALVDKGYYVTVGMGNVYTHLVDMHLSYKESCSAVTLSRIHGVCALYCFNDINYDGSVYKNQLQKIVDHKIYSHIKTGAFKEVKQDIAELLEELKISGIDFNGVTTVINNVILMSCKTLNELGYNVKDILGEEGLAFYMQDDTDLTYTDLEERLYTFYRKVDKFITSKRGNRTDKLIVEIKSYIDENYAENITLTSLSQEINISPSYLSLLFSELTSQNFSDYLTSIRIEKAKELLKNTDLRINEIATKTGYRDAYYFSTVFKKNSGITPTRYRENLNE